MPLCLFLKHFSLHKIRKICKKAQNSFAAAAPFYVTGQYKFENNCITV
jgi:hypothetical protein